VCLSLFDDVDFAALFACGFVCYCVILFGIVFHSQHL